MSVFQYSIKKYEVGKLIRRGNEYYRVISVSDHPESMPSGNSGYRNQIVRETDENVIAVHEIMNS